MNSKPASDAEWARDVERRLTALERPQSLRIGQWTITQRGNESLWALGDDGREFRIARSITDLTEGA